MAEHSDADAFQAEAEASVSPDARTNAAQIAETLAREELLVDEMEERLKERKAKLHFLRTVTVPEAMTAANQLAFKIASGPYAGVEVEIKDFVAGSLPKGPVERDRAIEWLEHNDGQDIIKSELVVTFRRGQHNVALDLVDKLRKEGYDCTFGENVHPQTLMAFGRERVKNGEPIDAETLGLFIGRTTKLKWPKVKGG